MLLTGRAAIPMKSALTFLVAAREREIGELEQLAQTSELVSLVGRLIHALQKERGLSNVYLASRGARFAEQRTLQMRECDEIAQQVRARFDALDTGAHGPRNGSRLFGRIAEVLHGLDAIAALRDGVATHALSAAESTAAYVGLVTGLLAVVFEAADSATDPQITRELVAMFNFMQGKEFAGQERAFGAMVFAGGHAHSREPWQHLIESQERCFHVFADFADPAVREAWHKQQQDPRLSELERLRRVGGSARAGTELDSNLSQAWYDCCTHRIDAMRAVEDLLAANLRALCERRIAQARAELHDQQAILGSLQRPSGRPAALGPQLERSIVELLQEQSRRLQTMSDELDTARAALNERKVVERAKGLLMASRRLSEDAAYKVLREAAMNQHRRIVDVAERVIESRDLLTPKG